MLTLILMFQDLDREYFNECIYRFKAFKLQLALCVKDVTDNSEGEGETEDQKKDA